MFDHLRAIAIMMVIATHCPPPANALTGFDFNEHHPIISLLAGATTIFVFLAGFFYEHIYRRRWTALALLRHRAAMLIPPYVFISLLLIAHGLEPGVRGLSPQSGSPLGDVALWLIFGTAGPATWFVPFILALLLFTPGFARFATAPPRIQLAILAALLVLGIAVPRHPFAVGANVAHFAFYYAFGIFWAVHRARLEPVVRRGPVLVLLALGLAGAAALQYAIGAPALYGAPEPLLHARDIMVVRKIILIALLIGVLSRWVARPVAPLRVIAELSFGLFFVHQPVLLWLVRAAKTLPIAGMSPALLAVVLWVATVALSLLILAAGRALLGRHAKLLLGA